MSDAWLATACTLLGLVVGLQVGGRLVHAASRRSGLLAGYRRGFRDGLEHAASPEFVDLLREFRETITP